MCIYVCMYVRRYDINTCVYVYIHMYTYTYVYTHVYTHVYTYTYIYIYIYIHIISIGTLTREAVHFFQKTLHVSASFDIGRTPSSQSKIRTFSDPTLGKS